MAERRMFAKSVVLSDAFLDMPIGTRCLYFTLCMNADDDGFVNCAKSVMRQAGACTDDLNILLGKQFLLGFPNGLIVIRHWHCNNYIRQDRHHGTAYVKELMSLDVDKSGAYLRVPEEEIQPALPKSEENLQQIGKKMPNNPPLLPCQPNDNRLTDTAPPSVAENSQAQISQNELDPPPQEERQNETKPEQPKEGDPMKPAHYETPYERFCQSMNKTAGPNRSPYGLYQNVMLSDEEYQDLSKRYGAALESCINRLSNGMKNKGYRYHHHYGTLIAWMEEDKAKESYQVKKNGETKISSFDAESFFDKAVEVSNRRLREEFGTPDDDKESEMNTQ